MLIQWGYNTLKNGNIVGFFMGNTNGKSTKNKWIFDGFYNGYINYMAYEDFYQFIVWIQWI